MGRPKDIAHCLTTAQRPNNYQNFRALTPQIVNIVTLPLQHLIRSFPSLYVEIAAMGERGGVL